MPSESTVLSKTYTDWDTRNGEVSHTVSLLVTPAVVVSNATIVVLYFTAFSQAEGRRYFGCDSLEGVELENQGGPGTAGSHWEKRILEVIIFL